MKLCATAAVYPPFSIAAYLKSGLSWERYIVLPVVAVGVLGLLLLIIVPRVRGMVVIANPYIVRVYVLLPAAAGRLIDVVMVRSEIGFVPVRLNSGCPFIALFICCRDTVR